MACTVISLRVRVPVLSEQIVVVLPSVSTAGSLRTIARRAAMRWTPMASAMVTMAGRPSGMAPTARAMAKSSDSLKASEIESPCAVMRRMPTTSMIPATTRMATVMRPPIVLSARVKGVSRSTVDLRSAEMRPSWVAAPVSTATASAVPYVTWVPPKTMEARSPRSASSGTAATCFSVGTDSPVRAASSARRLRQVRSRRSAGTRSPDARATMSPGTTSAAGMAVRRPSRRTVAVSGTICRSAPMA